MNKVLSQEEINALFSAMSPEKPGLEGRTEQTAGAPPIAQYEYHHGDIKTQDEVLCPKYDQLQNSPRPKTENPEAERVYELIRTISVSVGGEILYSKLTLNDLLKVSEGDIIELDERIGGPIYLCVGGVAMFKGRIIQRAGKKAFEITERFVD